MLSLITDSLRLCISQVKVTAATTPLKSACYLEKLT